MVCHNAHSHIHTSVSSILQTVGQALDTVDHRLEHIGVVVRLFALHGHAQTLEAHTGVYHFLGQLLKRAVCFLEVLHEHNVPYLDNLRVIFVDHLTTRHFVYLGLVAQVDMYLRARTARTRVAHLPEVIMMVAKDDTVGRHMFLPQLGCLGVLRQTLRR